MSSGDGPRISMMSDPETIDEIARILESAGLPVVAANRSTIPAGLRSTSGP